jgi:hypothetical protein
VPYLFSAFGGAKYKIAKKMIFQIFEYKRSICVIYFLLETCTRPLQDVPSLGYVDLVQLC